MSLSSDLISQFVKATKDNETKSTEATVYGTAVEQNGDMYVQLDGSDVLTPVTSTVKMESGERVVVTIKDHSAVVTGNVTTKSARSDDVEDIVDEITEVEILIADKVSTKEFDAERARIEELVVDNVTIKERLTADEVTISELEADNVVINETLTAQEAEIKEILTEKLDAEFAEITYATIENLEATNLQVNNLEATYGDFVNLTTERLDVINATIENLDAEYVSAEELDVERARIDILEAGSMGVDSALIKKLQADVAEIDTLIFGSASGDVIQTSFANAVIAQLGDAQIKSAMIESISADKITAGDIITNNVRVLSEDGKLLISDETIQISDDARVRVQIGKDSSGDYSINIWDTNGNLMFSEGGITDSAIKEAIIRNDMVSDTANIAAHKLDIDSLFEEINGSANTIKSTQIYLDDQAQTLDVAFKELETEVTDLGSTVSTQGTQITVLQGQIESKICQQDINTATDTISTQYSALEQEIDSVSATVASHTSELADKADSSTVTTVSDRVTTLEANLTGFQSTVSSTYATRNEVEEIEIGGRNLLLNTGGNELVTMRNGASPTFSGGVRSVVNSNGTMTLNCSTSIAEVYYRFMTPVDSTNNLYGLETGKTYTFSGKAQVTTTSGTLVVLAARTQYYKSGTGGAGWSGGINKGFILTDTTDWVDFSASFTIDDDATGCYVSIQLSYTDSWVGTIKLKDLQLEQGNKATAWSPAPEDYPTVDSVVAAQTSADAAQSDIDNLVIGGRNLLRNSKGHDVTVWVYSGLTVVEDDVKGHCVQKSNTSSSGEAYIASSRTGIVDQSTEYTFSADMWCNEYLKTYDFFWLSDTEAEQKTAAGYVNVTSGANRKLTPNVWQRVSWTFTTKADDYTGYIRIDNNGTTEEGTASILRVANLKMEKGNRATDWTPAPEDLEDRVTTAETKITQNSESITSVANRTTIVENKFANYSTTAQMNSAIEQSATSIKSTVSQTYTTKSEFANLDIGGRNLVAGTDDVTEYVKNVTDGTGTYYDAWTGKTIDIPTETEYIVSFDAKADVAQDITCYFYSPNTTTGSLSSTGHTSSSADGASKVTITTEWARYWVKWTQTVPETVKSIIVGRNYTENDVYIRAVKFEAGNKPTAWTPAPEDMATAKDNELAQTTADTALETATTAETLVQQLSDSITMLVTDGNGTSLMTQTESGWTFSTASIQTAIASAAEGLDALYNELGDTTNTVSVLQQAVDDLGEIAEYVKIGTYEDEPCIELGESDSEFKLRITNTQILFMEGSNIVAHINNQSLHIKKAVIEEELQQGGFVWKVRSNGNMGLVWKGVSS